ncbi:MAG: sugar porter family MFS transporter [Myxococcota bacterium]
MRETRPSRRAPIENRGQLGFVLRISGVATIGGFLFGFDSGVINGTVEGLQQAFQSDSAGTGFNVASMLLGCAVGAFVAGRLADRFGRRTLLLLSAIFFVVSAWGSGIAQGSLEFVTYRIVGGLAVGAASVLAPAYIAEVAPARIRGALATVQQIAIILGLFCAFLSNYGLAFAAGTSTTTWWLGYAAWRWMFWIEMAPAVLFFVALLGIPESPRFLVARGRLEEAKGVLGRLMDPPLVGAKVREIQTTLASDHAPRFSDLFGPGGVRPIVWVGIGLATFQQLVGINVVFYYGAVLWQAAGFSESDALLVNVISGGISVAAAFITVAVIDRIGRRPLLLVGSVGMALTLALVAGAFGTGTLYSAGHTFAAGTVLANGTLFAEATTLSTDLLDLSPAMGVVAVTAANAYVFLFNLSWGPVMWVMLGEMFPNQLRGSGLAVAGLFQWGSNFVVTMTFPLLLTSIGLAGAYGLYTIGALLSAVFVVALVPETKGLELEEMTG